MLLDALPQCPELPIRTTGGDTCVAAMTVCRYVKSPATIGNQVVPGCAHRGSKCSLKRAIRFDDGAKKFVIRSARQYLRDVERGCRSGTHCNEIVRELFAMP